MRPLTAAGRAAVERLAAEAAARGVKPAAIWHSGKLRARDTAEIYWRACNPLATISAERGLQPGDPPEWVRDRLLLEESDVMVVGHFPHIGRLWRVLLTGQADGAATEFPQHGYVMVERDEGLRAKG